MLRTTRTVASLIRSLLLGTAVVVPAALTTVGIVGCKDQSQPDYWVEKLDDLAYRPQAIKRLEQFFDDAMTKNNNDINSANVQALLGKILEPLTKTYVESYDKIDTKTRVSLIKLLANFRDKRTEPALKKTFDEFVKNPKVGKDDQDLKWAIRAQGDLQLETLADPLVQSFQKLRASSMLGGITYKDLADAMTKKPYPSWSGPLKVMLDADIVAPKDSKDSAKVDEFRDQLFWQTTAALLLGEIRDATAVESLMKVFFDPIKVDVQPTAILAMVKIGKPALDAAVKVLKEEDKKMVDFALARDQKFSGAKEPSKDKPYLQRAAILVGTIGRAEGAQPMMAALKGADKDIPRAILARELAKIPPTAETKAAFKTAFEAISIDANIPPGINGLQMLTESALMFYDPTMIDWLLERAEKTKGEEDAKKGLQSAITVACIKLMKPDQLDRVKKAVDSYGTDIEKNAFKRASELMKACGDKVSCFLDAAEKSENQEKDSQFTAIKGVYMAGILGNEQTRGDLIERLQSIDNAGIRYTVSQAIDYLSPKGSVEAADKLKAIIDANARSADKNKAAGDSALKQVMYRIRTRAN